MTTSTPAQKAPTVAAKRAPAKRAATATTKVAVKRVTKPVAKKAPASKSPVVRTSTAAKTVAAKPAKEKKPKLVRDSFTFPKTEYEVLEAMKQRATKLKVTVKKTELLRAGIKSLAALGDAAFLSAIAAVPSLKTGRPAKA
ncbi:MAG: hypothetical protein WCL01_00250 [Comamonadaceae bacterium]